MKKLVVIFTVLLATTTIFAKPKSAASQMPPAVVSIAPVKLSTWQDSIDATGSLAAFNGTIIKAETAGRITKILFKSGTAVKAGTPLVQIYPDVLKAQLDQAKAQLAFDQSDYDRASQLSKNKYMSASDLEQKQATLQSSQAKVNQLAAELSQTLITAPFDGQLGLRQVSLGDYVSAGTPIVNLESLDPIRVDFSIPEVYLNKIKVGQTVLIKSRAFPNQSFNGKIYAMNAAIDPDTRSLDCRATVPNKQMNLVPGAFVEVYPQLGTPQQLIIIPQTAIVYAADGAYVYLVNEKHQAIKTKVKLGQKLDQNRVIIQSGLKPGDQIITDGQVKIQSGDPVMSAADAAKMMQSMPKGKK